MFTMPSKAITFLLIFWIYNVESRINTLSMDFLCYKNPQHIQYNGLSCDSFPNNKCDPVFYICISTHRIPRYSFSAKNCNLYYKETEYYTNVAQVCKTPNDNRGLLWKRIFVKLGFPLQANYFIKISVWDKDLASLSRFAIGHFIGGTRNIRPTPNGGKPNMTIMNLDRAEIKYSNTDAMMKVAVGIQCGKGLYGRYCSVECDASSSSTFTCDYEGNKVCKKGWLGKDCSEEDKCAHVKCAKNADCVVSPKGKAICICHDDTAGPACYLDYDPCDYLTCANNGTCVVEATNKARCSCVPPYKGETCSQFEDPCKNSPCLNGGLCVSNQKKPTYVCQCTFGYQGTHCENETVPTTISLNQNTEPLHNNEPTRPRKSLTSFYTMIEFQTKDISLLLAIIVAVLVLCIAFLIFILIFRRQKTRRKFDKLPALTINQLIEKEKVNDRHLLSPSSNTCSTPRLPHSVYETVEDTWYTKVDECPYSEVVDNIDAKEDDYLQPMSDKTFTSSPTDTSDAYLPMKSEEDDDAYLEQKKNSDVENPPPLPIRISQHLKQEQGEKKKVNKHSIQQYLCVKGHK